MTNKYKGFIGVKIVLILFFLLIIGGGGYIGYRYLTDPDFNFFGLLEEPLIPSSLASHVPGANADSIILYRSTEDLNSVFRDIMQQLEVANAPVQPNNIVSAVIVIKSPNEAESFEGAALAALEFSDAQKASFVAGQVSALSAFVPIETKIEDAVLIIRLNAEVFEGSINDNPLLAKVDTDYEDSEIIMLTDVTAMSEMNMVTYSLLNSLSASSNTMNTAFFPIAHAQLISPTDQPGRLAEATGGKVDPMAGFTTSMNTFLNFTKFQSLYIRVNDDVGEVYLVLEFADKSELPSLFDNIAPGMDLSSENINELEEVYDKMLGSLDEMIAQIQEESQSPEFDYADVTIERKGTILTVHASGDLNDLQDLPAVRDMQEGPMRARDAARKADVNNITYAIEIYNADVGKYPPKSACVEDMEPLIGEYFPSDMPEDPSGTVIEVSDDFSCSSGYFYASYEDAGYVLWTKMEGDTYGNRTHIVLPPSVVEEEESGKYYALIQADFAKYEESVTKEESKIEKKSTGVSRGVKRDSSSE